MESVTKGRDLRLHRLSYLLALTVGASIGWVVYRQTGVEAAVVAGLPVFVAVLVSCGVPSLWPATGRRGRNVGVAILLVAWFFGGPFFSGTIVLFYVLAALIITAADELRIDSTISEMPARRPTAVVRSWFRDRKIALGWTAAVAVFIAYGLAASEGEPVCEGPLIIGVSHSLPPQCDPAVQTVPLILAGWAAVLLGITRTRQWMVRAADD